MNSHLVLKKLVFDVAYKNAGMGSEQGWPYAECTWMYRIGDSDHYEHNLLRTKT